MSNRQFLIAALIFVAMVALVGYFDNPYHQ